MRIINCKICCKAYDDKNILPRILTCGHTFCSDCITSLISNTRTCAICREELVHEDTSDYIINYIVIELCEESVHPEFEVKCLWKRTNELRDKHKEILTKLRPFTGIFEKVAKLEENGEKLNDFISNINEITTTLNGMEKLVEELSNNDLITSKGKYFDLHSVQYESTGAFIKKIFMDVYSKKSIIAIGMIGGEEKISRISIDEDKLLLHSLGTIERDFSALTVKFKDMRLALIDHGFWSKKLHGFLDLSTQNDVPLTRRIFIQLLSELDMCSLFLSLLSGEYGLSYLECSCKLQPETISSQSQNRKECSYLATKSNEISQNWKEKYLHYFNRVQDIDVHSASYVLNFKHDGSFMIYPRGGGVKNGLKIGIVLKDDSFKIDGFLNSSNEIKIINCGIAIQM